MEEWIDEPEDWVEIDDFPEYSVSTYGRISNDIREIILTPSINGHGIPTVGMSIDKRQYRRSVPVLVADAWVPNSYGAHFNTPTHLDGDRINCHADNLVWRPRWFAIQYHKAILVDQFPEMDQDYWFECLQTQEVFNKLRIPALKYGVLERDIFFGLLNKRPVFPDWLEFRRMQ